MKKLNFNKKFAAGLAISALITGITVQPAWAAIDAGSLSKIISNTLVAQFNVTQPLSGMIAVLTWGDDHSSSPKTISATQGETQTVMVTVNPGADLTSGAVSSKTIGVILEVSDATKVQSVTAGGAPARKILANGKTYYVLKEGLTLNSTTKNVPANFDITFSSSGSYTYNIFAVEDNGASTGDAGSEPTSSQTSPASFFTIGEPGDNLDNQNFASGATGQTIRMDYRTQETFNNATMVINVDGIQVTTDDYYHNGTSWVNYTADQISNDGHTITLTGLNTSYISFEWDGKTIPAPGTYSVRVKADADGDGTSKTFSDEDIVTFTSVAP